MNTLVIGAGGFVGGYLLSELAKTQSKCLFATKLKHEKLDINNITVYNLDVTDFNSVRALIENVQPSCIYHLAAQSSAALSWNCPQLTVNVNVIGVLNVLEAVRQLDVFAKILLIGSGEEYGNVLDGDTPISENTAVHPTNIYAISKLAQNLIGNLYHKAYNMEIISARAFNHMGPTQSETFVVSDFCRQIATIENEVAHSNSNVNSKNSTPTIFVGNLSAIRDFTDVRDVVRAYILLIQRGCAGKTYNVGGGTVCSIRQLLDETLKLSDIKITIEVDEKKLRPIDTAKICADISSITTDTGWAPTYPLAQTLSDTLNYWRNNLC